jgi:hypothetical protein
MPCGLLPRRGDVLEKRADRHGLRGRRRAASGARGFEIRKPKTQAIQLSLPPPRDLRAGGVAAERLEPEGNRRQRAAQLVLRLPDELQAAPEGERRPERADREEPPAGGERSQSSSVSL